jgi:hypothetical protein
MKKTLLLLLSTCIANVLLAQQPFFVKSFAADGIKSVESITAGGNISLESVTADQQRVEMFVQASNSYRDGESSKADLQSKLDLLYDIVITAENGKLTTSAKRKHENRNKKSSLSISFKIFVTKNVSGQLTTSGGNIELRNLSGDQNVTTSGGNIAVENIKGKLKGVTSGGNIKVKEANDEVDLATSGGNIEASDCGGMVKLGTSGGNISLEKMNGNISASTSGGDVHANDVKGDLSASTSGGNVVLTKLMCNVTAGTSGGDVKVEMTEPAKFIKLSNSGGRIDLQLPAGKGYEFDLHGEKIKTDGLVNFSGSIEEDRLKGSMNGGGTKVSANAGSSRINVSFQ